MKFTHIKLFKQNAGFWFLLAGLSSLFAIYTFGDSLKLALTGDDWLLHYTIWQIFDVNKSLSYFNPTTYLCTYCPPYGYLSLIRYFWGFDPVYHYVISLIIRIITAVSIGVLVYKATNSKFVSIISSIFFSVIYIGIQTTDWVFNMNHYLGVAGISLFLLSYFKLQNKLSPINIATTLIFFLFSLIISPPRMHGLIPFIILIDIFYFLSFRKDFSFKKFILRIVILITSYKLLLSSGGYGGFSYVLGLIKDGINLALDSINSGNSSFILYPISSMGNFIFPDMLWTKMYESISFLRNNSFLGFYKFILPTGFVYFLLTLPIFMSIRSSKLSIGFYGLLLLLWLILLRFIRLENLNYLGSEQLFYSIIGGCSLIFSISLFLVLRKSNPRVALLFITSTLWMVCFTLFPWILAPYGGISSWMRYSIQQAAGVVVWFACIVYLLNDTASLKILFKTYGFVIIFTFVSMHSLFSKQYINDLLSYRSEKQVSTMWNDLLTEVPVIDRENVSIFYMTYDDFRMVDLGMRFMFPPRAAIEYEILRQENVPFIVYEYNDALNAVYDGSSLVKLGLKQKKIPLKNIYSFELKEGRLINRSEETRLKIERDLKLKNSLPETSLK